jgi:XTP/dITP diphosphohydrolase
MKWVIASSNAGKLREFREMLGDSGIEFVTQGELGIADADETGLTFVENALLKARKAARETGMPALGDDSGLCVDALGGAPGLYSARYAGVHGTCRANIDKLLDALRDVPEAQRGAHFYAVIVLLRHAEDPQPLIAEGVWSGRILHERRGDGGFGYDRCSSIPVWASAPPNWMPNARTHKPSRPCADALRARLLASE